MYLGSDALAVGPFAQTISCLEEGDIVRLSRAGAQIQDRTGNRVDRPAVDVSAFLAPLICSIPVLLRACCTALEKGTDVDQPRNLAKWVSVE